MSRRSSSAALLVAPLVAVLVLGGCGGEDPAQPDAASSLPADHPPTSSAATGGPSAERVPSGPVQFRVVAEYNTGDAACAADPVPGRRAPQGREVTLCDRSGLAHRLEPAAAVGGVESAEAAMPDDSTRWLVNIQLDREGAAAFEDLTRQVTGTGQQIAIVHGGRVLSAPAVEGVITSGQLQISGSFTADEAEQLAADLSGR